MNNSKLIRILNVCKNEEIKLIEKCIYSPFFNESEDVKLLWHYLKKHLGSIPSEKLAKNYVFQKLFPHQSYNDAKMRRVMSALVKIIEKFLFLHINNENFTFKQSLTQFYYEKYLDKEFENELTALELENEADGKKNATYFENVVVIEKYKMYKAYKQFRIEKGHEDRNLSVVLQSRDKTYLIGQLELYCAMLNNSKSLKIMPYQGFLTQIIDFYKQNHSEDEEVPIIQMYLSIQALLEKKNHSKEEITEITTYLSQHTHLFHRNEIAYFSTTIRNIVRRIANQDFSFQLLLFELYKEHIKNGSLFSYNKIATNTFVQIIMQAILVNDVIWAATFLEEYAQFLPPEQAESTILFTKALLTFHQKDYKKRCIIYNKQRRFLTLILN